MDVKREWLIAVAALVSVGLGIGLPKKTTPPVNTGPSKTRPMGDVGPERLDGSTSGPAMSAPPPSRGAPSTGAGRIHVVQNGDTLMASPASTTMIRANGKRSQPQTTSRIPNQLKVGQKSHHPVGEGPAQAMSDRPGRRGGEAANLGLDDPVRFLKGVGPDRAGALASLGIETVRDLIHYFPIRARTLRARLSTSKTSRPTRSRPSSARSSACKPVGFGRATPHQGDLRRQHRPAALHLVQRPWMLEKLQPGIWLKLRGKMQLYADWPAMTNPETEVIDGPVPTEAGQQQGLLPVYRVCEGLTSKQVAQLDQPGLEGRLPPDRGVVRRPLAARAASSCPAGWPCSGCTGRKTRPSSAEARRRLAYDELLLLQLAVAIRRWHIRDGRRAPAMPLSEEIDRRIRKRFPFAFTAAQDRAAREIVADMARPVPMNRLLEGDVGSGKTAVAVYASLLAIAHRWQVAILAPTEILAEQHYARICQYLAGSKVRHGLLTGGTATPRPPRVAPGRRLGPTRPPGRHARPARRGRRPSTNSAWSSSTSSTASASASGRSSAARGTPRTTWS